MLLGGPQVLRRVHRPQRRVVGDELVETVHEPGECVLPADGLIERTGRSGGFG